MRLHAPGAPALNLQHISAVLSGVFDGFRYFSLLPLYPQNDVLNFLGEIHLSCLIICSLVKSYSWIPFFCLFFVVLPLSFAKSVVKACTMSVWCINSVWSIFCLSSGIFTLCTVLLMLRGCSCSQRSSGCDLVRSHKTSMGCCDHYCGGISPGKIYRCSMKWWCASFCFCFQTKIDSVSWDYRYDAEFAHLEG